MKRWIAILVVALCVVPGLLCQTQTGDIETYIHTHISNLPGADEFNYTVPTSGELLTWEEIISHLINDELAEARQKAEILNYQVVEYEDNSIIPHSFYYVLEEKSAREHYWGTYIINRDPLRSGLVIQSPHPLNDFNTGKQGIYCFKHLGALAFCISGTHRCNHDSFSACSGTTSTCSGTSDPYRVSDHAHNVTSVFQKTTEVLYTDLGHTVFVQLHGFGKKASDPYVIMSNGTRETPDPDFVSLLKEELYQADNSLTFKIGHIDLEWSRLLAFTNVQGRFINQSEEPCTQNATSTTGRFIHIEQEKEKLREDLTGWMKMNEALANTFPETPSSARAQAPEWKSQVTVYPNPSEGWLKVNASTPSWVSVYDPVGKCVFNTYTDARIFETDLSTLIPGIYLVKVTNDMGTQIKKIIFK